MRVLFDIQHPAEVHFFRVLIDQCRLEGDEVVVTTHSKAGVSDLLKAHGQSHRPLSRPWPTALGIAAVNLFRTLRLLILAIRWRPQVMVARISVATGIVGKLLRIPTIGFDENEYYAVQRSLSYRFVEQMYTGMGYERNLGPKQVRFGMLPQLLYTHPQRFVPDPGIRDLIAPKARKLVVIRLSAWQAIHDHERPDLTEAQLVRLVKALEQIAQPVLSAEANCPKPLEPYQMPSLPIEKGLDLLAAADLYIGEGGSMAAEAACLGTPAVFVSGLRCGYLNLLADDYGLLRQTTDVDQVLEWANWALSDEAQTPLREAHERLLRDSIDPLPEITAAIHGAKPNKTTAVPPQQNPNLRSRSVDAAPRPTESR